MKNKLLLIALLICCLSSVKAQNPVKPKLVVNITVAGLRYDYLLKFNKGFSSRGIMKLINEGAVCSRALIDYSNSTTPVGVATIATGAAPSSHGVVGEYWFDYTTGTRMQLGFDKEVLTVGDDAYDAQLSPRSLVASTIGDCISEIEPSSKVISVALNPLPAVIAGGFNADGVYWVSQRSGKMVSSSYYTKNLPDWVNNFNKKELAAAYCSATWKLSKHKGIYYNVLRSDIKESSTMMSLGTKKFDYEKLITTPAANSLIKDFAVQSILAEELGKDSSTDYLSVVFESPRCAAAKYGPNSMEVEDVLYRLDIEIEALLAFLESQVGKENMLVIFSSAHGSSDAVIESSKVPVGHFNASQFEILMNGFLGAQLSARMDAEQIKKSNEYGERWALEFLNNQLYLNRRKIYAAGFSLSEVQDIAANFAIQFRGVASAITSTTMQSGEFTSGVMGSAQRSYFARHSGDVVLNFLPGWIDSSSSLSQSGSPYIYDTHVPLVFWGGGVVPQTINNEVKLQDIAPTVAAYVGVTPPNASTGRPIEGIFKK